MVPLFFSLKGGGKQKADSKTLLYTNAIVTIIIGDGIDCAPWMLFTHDPKMERIEREREEELEKSCKRTESPLKYSNNQRNG